MGLLDDAIREHLELKRRSGAAETEVSELEKEVLGAAPAPVPEPEAELPEEPAVEIPAVPEAEAAVEVPRAEPEPWLDDPDEVPFDDALDHSSRRTTQPTTEFTAEDVADAHGQPAEDYVAPDEEPGEDLLEETPDFLQETPEHDRLWFEQKPPRDFDFGA
jgi:hypothetical protein